MPLNKMNPNPSKSRQAKVHFNQRNQKISFMQNFESSHQINSNFPNQKSKEHTQSRISMKSPRSNKNSEFSYRRPHLMLGSPKMFKKAKEIDAKETYLLPRSSRKSSKKSLNHAKSADIIQKQLIKYGQKILPNKHLKVKIQQKYQNDESIQGKHEQMSSLSRIIMFEGKLQNESQLQQQEYRMSHQGLQVYGDLLNILSNNNSQELRK